MNAIQEIKSQALAFEAKHRVIPVSYTHLTLPKILLV